MDFEQFESIAVVCNTKQEYINLVELLNKNDNREYINKRRTESLKSEQEFKSDICCSIYRGSLMSSEEAGIFGYIKISYNDFYQILKN